MPIRQGDQMNPELAKALRQAVSFEKNGRAIYEEAASKTKNPLISKTFKYLAEQEDFHLQEIQNYLTYGKIEFLGDQPETTQQFFSTTVSEYKHKAEATEDDLDAYETALELEKESYNFYLAQHNATADPDLKQFFDFLMQQEKIHYELVKRTYEFIKDPAAFYSKEEQWIFEGW